MIQFFKGHELARIDTVAGNMDLYLGIFSKFDLKYAQNIIKHFGKLEVLGSHVYTY